MSNRDPNRPAESDPPPDHEDDIGPVETEYERRDGGDDVERK